MNNSIDILDFDYPLPSERIAKFPLQRREDSKLLVFKDHKIDEGHFYDVANYLPKGAALVFNNTKVVRARLIFHKASGARIEVFCLEPADPADYERAFAVTESSTWHCMVGNSKKWKEDQALEMPYEGGLLRATRGQGDVVNFEWDPGHTFGQMLEAVGRIPIPPYLERESQDIDTQRYQTVYSRFEGSVAAPTAGLHFSDDILEDLRQKGFSEHQVTLHVGAGTFLPVKAKDARDHNMHTECFEVNVQQLRAIAGACGCVVAVGTTSVRTLESLAVLGERVMLRGDAELDLAVGQWEAYADENQGLVSSDINSLLSLCNWCESKGMDKIVGSTQIMITPGYRFRVVRGIITNFHQPKSTLLLLISALVGDRWRDIYDYALGHDFRFLSYGDSSLLLP